MKCPKCNYNQAHKSGLICNGCGYHFVLDPKDSLGLSDMGMKVAIDKISDDGRLYYTYNQLLMQLARQIRKKEVKGCLIAIAVMFILIVLALLSLFGSLGLLGLIVVLPLVYFCYKFRHQDVPFRYYEEAIKKYRSAYDLEKIVEGRALVSMGQADDMEQLQYAPERVLIVEHDDMADMLILNRFHMDSKTLVLSANKYPASAFAAYEQLMLNFPDTPVNIAHDASKQGLRLKSRLVKSQAWGLEGKDIIDLGLFLLNVDKDDSLIWLPDYRAINKRLGPYEEEGAYEEEVTHKNDCHDVVSGGDARKNLEKGLFVPVDFASPRVMSNVLTLAGASGMVLLSQELADALKKEYSTSGGGMSGFSGYG